MAWIDRLPVLVVVGLVILALAPFAPMPHVVEKLIMLSEGRLQKPMDWFDLVLHGGAAMVAVIYLLRKVFSKMKAKG